jgi:cytochrome c
MKYIGTLVTILSLAAGAASAESHATGNAADGEKGFKKCKACHLIAKEDGTEIVKGGKTGPNLYGVVGRVAGSLEGFKYGDSIVALGETGFVWAEEDFVTYLADPTDFLRTKLDDKKAKSKMSFKLKKQDDALDIWAYLASVTE